MDRDCVSQPFMPPQVACTRLVIICQLSGQTNAGMETQYETSLGLISKYPNYQCLPFIFRTIKCPDTTELTTFYHEAILRITITFVLEIMCPSKSFPTFNLFPTLGSRLSLFLSHAQNKLQC